MAMASAVLTPYLSHTSSSSSSPSPTVSKKSPICAYPSTSQISYSKNPVFRSLVSVPQLGLASFSPWSGLRRNAVSISLRSLRFERRRKCKGKGVFASLFGVGAPEALVIGVVALLVFGPKGLAEIAKNLGKTLRAFQPTIKELQEVSREFKSTIEKEIGLEELQNAARGNYSSSNIATLTSSPLSDAMPENSKPTATETETAAAAARKLSQVTETPLAASAEGSEATATTPGATTEDSQATASTPAATMEDSQATASTPAATMEDSQATTTPPAVATEDS